MPGLTTTKTTSLVTLSASEIASAIAAGDVSAVEVTEQHIEQIQVINPRLNALTQPLFDQARQDAAEVDRQLAAGEELGPLAGVPVSIKDCFAIRETEITLGIQGFAKARSRAEAPLVERLRAAGAVVLGKTNVPQGMLMHECDNPLFGRTLHPSTDDLLSEQRSPGGSTGGEAALVAAKGSPLGLGSDLGGSIRQPAAACGLFGLKPTSGRLSLVGTKRAMPGFKAIAIQPGPLTRSAADIDLAMRVLTDKSKVSSQRDERNEAWLPPASVAGKRIVYWTDDGVFPTAPAIRRAVEEAAAALASAGATVQEVRPPLIDEMLRIYFGLLSADGLGSLRRALGKSSVDPQLKLQLRLARLPAQLRPAFARLLSLAGQGSTAKVIRMTGPRSANDYWQLIEQADDFGRQFWQSLESTAGGSVDAVLSPAYALPALKHGTALYMLLAASHCFLANLLDSPAGVAPWDSVTAEDEAQAQEELLNNRQQASRLGSYARKIAIQNAQGSAGLPTAVQVMARPWQDNLVTGMLKELDTARGVTPPKV